LGGVEVFVLGYGRRNPPHSCDQDC
jgi:hypothetical protein